MGWNCTNKSVQRLRKNSGSNEGTVRWIAWGSPGIAVTRGFHKQVIPTFVRNYAAIIYAWPLEGLPDFFFLGAAIPAVINLTDKILTPKTGVLVSSFCSHLDKSIFNKHLGPRLACWPPASYTEALAPKRSSHRQSGGVSRVFTSKKLLHRKDFTTDSAFELVWILCTFSWFMSWSTVKSIQAVIPPHRASLPKRAASHTHSDLLRWDTHLGWSVQSLDNFLGLNRLTFI